jgi:hypothetical protein
MPRYFEITKTQFYSVLANDEEEALAMVDENKELEPSQTDFDITFIGGKIDE